VNATSRDENRRYFLWSWSLCPLAQVVLMQVIPQWLERPSSKRFGRLMMVMLIETA
jgi:hypothetical protein